MTIRAVLQSHRHCARMPIPFTELKTCKSTQLCPPDMPDILKRVYPDGAAEYARSTPYGTPFTGRGVLVILHLFKLC